MRLLATVKITSLTPSAIGGYNPNQHDEILRGTSLRGLAAWWLRTIVSGKAYDKGDAEHREKAIKIQKKILGSTEQSSLLVIRPQINSIRRINISTLTYMTKRGPSVKHIRLQLLLMGEKNKRKVEEILRGMLRWFDATLKVYSLSRNDEFLDEEVLGLHALLLSLFLEGIGKGARRGLGAVKVKNTLLSQDVEKYLQKNNYKGLLEIVQNKLNGEGLKRIIEDALEIAEKVIEKNSEKRSEVSVRETAGKIPKIPSLSRSAAEIYSKNINRAQTCEKRLVNLKGLLETLFLRSPPPSNKLVNKLQNTVKRQKRTKEGRVKNVSSAMALGSYILGLPRAAKNPPQPHEYRIVFQTEVSGQKKTNKVKTLPQKKEDQYSGFIELKDRQYQHYRRPSPVIVTLLDEETAVITLFKSSDWPEKLEWFTCKQKEMTTLTVAEAYGEVSEYLRNYCQRKIWP